MSESQQFQSGQIIEKLSSLEKSRTEQLSLVNKSIDNLEQRFEAFTRGLGERVGVNETKTEIHGTRLSVLEASMSLLNKVAWLLFASSMGVVVTAFWKLIMK